MRRSRAVLDVEWKAAGYPHSSSPETRLLTDARRELGPGRRAVLASRPMAKALEYNATLVERIDLTDALSMFRVKPDQTPAERPWFVPGQYCVLGLNNEDKPELGSVRRSMSIASAPEDDGADRVLHPLGRQARVGEPAHAPAVEDQGRRAHVHAPGRGGRVHDQGHRSASTIRASA